MNPINWITYSLRLIRTRYAPAYIVMNLLFYGVIGLGMLIVMQHPEVQRSLTQSVQKSFQSPGMSIVAKAYSGRHLLEAIVITFGVNLVLGTAMALSLPSLLIPFIGIGIGMWRALLWGLLFGPGPTGNFGVLATHWPVMLIEGQAYILGMLSVYIHGKAIFQPASVGATGHWEGYKRGFFEAMRLYPLIALVLAISAAYEVPEVIYFVHR
jgi:hypothetical protein